jgi:REP element-mobilizing transposase RayT
MRYNRKSPRKKRWDYSSVWGYFVTICTDNRKHYFGEIIDWDMILNDLWKHTYNCRNQIPIHYPFVTADKFICMPNHIHGILFIGERLGTYYNTSLDTAIKKQWIQPKSWSLGAIVRGFKIWITKYAKQNTIPFKRQGRYHDYLVRNTTEYNNFKNYILNNPKNWSWDTFHT